MFWEYLWCLSLPASFLALRAIKHNCIKNISLYIKWIVVLGVLPVIYGFISYLPDVYTVLSGSSTKNVQMWRVSVILPKTMSIYTYNIVFVLQNFSYGLLWYSFLTCAIQIHGFEIYFALNLKSAWTARGTAQKKK